MERRLGAREPAALAPYGRLFHMWHSTQFFSVPSAARWGLFPGEVNIGFPPDCPCFYAPEYLCAPTPSAIAYVAAYWMPIGQAGSMETERTPPAGARDRFVRMGGIGTTVLPPCRPRGPAVLHEGPDPLLLARRDEPIGERGVLFRLQWG